MRLLFVVFSLLLSLCFSTSRLIGEHPPIPNLGPVKWESYSEARARAISCNEPFLVMISSEWCTFCPAQRKAIDELSPGDIGCCSFVYLQVEDNNDPFACQVAGTPGQKVMLPTVAVWYPRPDGSWAQKSFPGFRPKERLVSEVLSWIRGNHK